VAKSIGRNIGRNGELFSVLCDPAHLIRSARAAARGKKKRPDAARFLLDMEPECFRLADQLASGEWMPGSYQTFTIREPKPRLISAAPFRDRVVHHAIVSILEPHFERRFVAHSYACRKGKGTHRALERAAELSRKRKFVLKGDLSKFFPSIDHEILKGEVRRVIADEQLLAVLERSIDGSNPQEPVWEWFAGDDLFTPCARRRGIPIGNLTSQFLANVFLDRFDHLVMDREGYGEYVRYCDDFLVFADSRSELWELRARIDAHLCAMRLRLHPKKGGVHATMSTIPFLGFTLRRGVKRLQRAGVVRGRRRLRASRKEFEAGALDAETLRARVAAWRGHALHASNQDFAERVLLEEGCAHLSSAVS
jgi:RNA-directed DNA polymerase